jgi:hypothetical protein
MTKPLHWLTCAAALVLGCSGVVADAPTAPDQDANVTPPEDRPAATPDVITATDLGVITPADASVADVPVVVDAPPAIGPFAPTPASMKRLTLRQYRNSVRDLLGQSVRVPTDLEVDTPLYGFSTIGAAQLSVSPRAAEQFEAAALDVAHQVFASSAMRAALVGCTPATAGDACVQRFVTTFGRKAWRRPLTTEERARWMSVVSTVTPLFNDVWAGLEYAVAGMLQSPHFLYRVELGEPDPMNASRRRYTAWEMAERLSYFVWNTTPDDALLTAAETGTLYTVDGLQAQARRLLASPRARESIGNFFTEHLKLDRLDTVTRDPTVYPLMSPTLPGAMRTEVLKMLEDIVFTRDVDVREMFDTRSTFVNDELARLYSLPFSAPAGPAGAFASLTLPTTGPRGGVLTTAGFLTLNAHATETSPTLRGRFIRQYLLCQDIPPPPPNVTTTLPPPTTMPRTLRQRLEEHRVNPTCAGCHALMDPIGFGLEHFDSLGQYRTTDHGLPVDASGEIDGMRFRNARELGAILRGHPRSGACLTRQVYRYATSHVDSDGEAVVLRDLAEAFTQGGHHFQSLVVGVVTSDGFRYASATGGM